MSLKPTVALIDDNEFTLNLWEANLKNEYNLITTTDPEVIKSAGGKIDVLICDQHMGEESGNDILRYFLFMHEETVRIIYSAGRDLELTQQAINEIGIFKFIDQAEGMDSIKSTIKEALEFKEKNKAKFECDDASSILKSRIANTKIELEKFDKSGNKKQIIEKIINRLASRVSNDVKDIDQSNVKRWNRMDGEKEYLKLLLIEIENNEENISWSEDKNWEEKITTIDYSDEGFENIKLGIKGMISELESMHET
ncbi:hypothetical protein A3715_18100 [Oleiphilus sp. HI0009]|nr:hypothetical protein A3715_18100 [Oleiphilus sp. HI0009]